ncbi:MAG: sulfatase-like hydrolase/transferase [Acidobacteriota bacterium]
MTGPKKLIILTITVSLVLLFIFSANCSKKKHTENYNVVLIVSDALRSDVLGCYGGDASTPNIDRLAKRGVLFENAYSTAPSTLPSSVAMFSGNYSGSYGMITRESQRNKKRNRIAFYVNDNETLLAEVFKDRSYDVLMELENQVAGLSNNLQGFNKFKKISRENRAGINLVENITGIRSHHPRRKGKSGSNPFYNRMYALLHYLLTVPEDQNFFVMKWIIDPHGPYNPIEKFKKKITFDPTTLPGDESLYTGGLKAIREHASKNKLSNTEIEYIKSLYKAEVESVDERIGYIMKALTHRGLLDNTIIVFTSDHGELFGEHGRLGHGQNHYEQLLRVPLIFAGPGIPKGKREKSIISNLDLMPTLKDLLGMEYDHNMQGQSYSALFSGEKVPDRTLFFDKATNIIEKAKKSALLMDDYKLIVTKMNSGLSYELFNLTNDPSELKNVSLENQTVLKKMLKKYMEFKKEINIRLKENIKKIDKRINFDEKWLKAKKELKTLGYL